MDKETAEDILERAWRIALAAKTLKAKIRNESDMYEKAATIELMARTLSSMVRKKFNVE